ncbi:putative acetyltransferase [Alkalispirochaeta americana]|uniref:Putative acetyltransferase n=1 Tax=Alkalispirochaeta americana TaxID=159291 RepID=A0A1N6VSV6_9SPIO|nr:N-acetyltransferase [Alkalispirochaeta americana]SIQ80953.1 putative acetyltransferase [Alkalispirochaeta americana]
MIIREETEEDIIAVRAIHEAAFGSPAEAELVDTLRSQVRPIISMVAVEGALVVGHIFFSPVTLNSLQNLKLMGLAPMAVMPGHQRGGVGSALVVRGLEECANRGVGAVTVLGHPAYYPRFGFLPSVRFGIRSEYPVPEEVFMIKELIPNYLHDHRGTINYHEAFGDV